MKKNAEGDHRLSPKQVKTWLDQWDQGADPISRCADQR